MLRFVHVNKLAISFFLLVHDQGELFNILFRHLKNIRLSSVKKKGWVISGKFRALLILQMKLFQWAFVVNPNKTLTHKKVTRERVFMSPFLREKLYEGFSLIRMENITLETHFMMVLVMLVAKSHNTKGLVNKILLHRIISFYHVPFKTNETCVSITQFRHIVENIKGNKRIG